MKQVLAILLFTPCLSWAQQPSPATVQGVVAEIEAQRQIAQTRAAQLAGELAEAKAALAEALKKCGKACEAEGKK